jgi:RNA polymerase sigma factor for flagellar operon FliA
VHGGSLSASEPTACEAVQWGAVLTDIVHDQLARDREFLLYQGLVRAVAWRVHRKVSSQVELDDLIAYGQIGLLEALQRFDEERGLKFATFAWHRVRGAILDGLAKMNWFDRMAFEQGVYEQHSTPETGNANASGRPPRSIVRSQLDASSLAASGEQPLAGMERREALAFLMTVVADLPAREAGLLRGVFFEGRTLSESARRVGISTAWASRLQNRTLADLRLALERHGFA